MARREHDELSTQRGVINPILLVVVGLIAVAALVFGGVEFYQSSTSSKSAEEHAKVTAETGAKIADLEKRLADLSAQAHATTSVVSAKTEPDPAVKKLTAELDALKKKKTENTTAVATAFVAPSAAPPEVTQAGSISKVDIVKKISPSVVFVGGLGSGSGFAVAPDLVLTNQHVVEGSYAVKLKTYTGQEGYGYVIGFDKAHDIAVLQTDGLSSLTPLGFGSSDAGVLPTGTEIYVFGFPFGKNDAVSFKEGSVSRRLTLDDADYIEVSAEVHFGNSGGPIVNAGGEVVGVSAALYGMQVGEMLVGEASKLAIPGNIAKSAFATLSLNRLIFSSEEKKVAVQYLDFMSRLNKAEADFGKAADLLAKAETDRSAAEAGQADVMFADVVHQLDENANKANGAYPATASFNTSIESVVSTLRQLCQKMRNEVIPLDRKFIEDVKKEQWAEANADVTNQNVLAKELDLATNTYRAAKDKLSASVTLYFGH